MAEIPAYLIIEFIQTPQSPNLDRYVIVPNLWVEIPFENPHSQRPVKVVVKYPDSEKPRKVNKRVSDYENYLEEWDFYVAYLRHAFDDYKRARAHLRSMCQDKTNTLFGQPKDDGNRKNDVDGDQKKCPVTPTTSRRKNVLKGSPKISTSTPHSHKAKSLPRRSGRISESEDDAFEIQPPIKTGPLKKNTLPRIILRQKSANDMDLPKKHSRKRLNSVVPDEHDDGSFTKKRDKRHLNSTAPDQNISKTPKTTEKSQTNTEQPEQSQELSNTVTVSTEDYQKMVFMEKMISEIFKAHFINANLTTSTEQATE